MMPPLLNDELVKTYFPCPLQGHKNHDCYAQRAVRVLFAMHDKILKGEKYLVSMDNGIHWEVQSITACPEDSIFHPWLLRLPDNFQPPPERESIICIHAKRCNCEWCCEHCPPKCECWELIPKMLCEKHKPPSHPSCPYCGICYPSDLHIDNCKPPSPAKGPGETAGCHHSQLGVTCPNCSGPVVEKTPETAKCDKANQAGHHAVNNCGCLCCIPAIRRAVEAKIKEMAEREKAPGYWRAILTHEKELRELVDLARKEGKCP